MLFRSRAAYFGRQLQRAAHSSARAALSPLLVLRPARAGAGALPPTHGRAQRHPAHPVVQPRPPAAAAAIAAGNPSAGSVGVVTAGAPPSVGLARSLFLPPRMTTPTGGVAPAPSRAAAAPLERKKGKTSAKKKTTDGSGSSKPKKKVAVRRPGAASTEAPASSLVEPAADAHHVFNEMPTR